MRKRILSLPRLAAAVSLLGLQVATYGQPVKVLPSELAGVRSLYEARQRLISLRQRGAISQPEMMDLARRLDPLLRGGEMTDLHVFDAVKKESNPDQWLRQQSEIERSGSSPAKGRGIFSDEDLQTKNAQQYEALATWAEKRGYHVIEQDRYSFKIVELDAVVWKPVVPYGVRPPQVIEEATAGALSREFSRTSRPNQAPNPAESIEAVLENTTKGSDGLFHPLEDKVVNGVKQPRPYWEQEELVLAAAKDVERSLAASGLCQSRPELCTAIEQMRRMEKEPRDCAAAILGHPADSNSGALLEEYQTKLRGLIAESYQAANRRFESAYSDLNRRLAQARSSGDADALRALTREAQEMEQRLIRMGTRFEVLSHQQPEMMRAMTNTETVMFWSEQNKKLRGLKEFEGPIPATRAGAGRRTTSGNPGEEPQGNAGANLEKLNVALNIATFAECYLRDPSQDNRAAMTRCLGEAAAMYAVGEAANKLLVFVVPPYGAIFATGLLTAKGFLDSATQIYDATFEFVKLTQAWQGAKGAEAMLNAARQKNAPDLLRRLKEEEESVRDMLPGLSKRRATLVAWAGELRRGNVDRASAIESGQRRLLDLTARLNARMAPACELAQHATGMSLTDVQRIEQQADQVEALLKGGQTLLNQCTDARALTQAEQNLRRAGDLAATIEEANKAAGARVAMQSESATLAETRRLQDQLHQEVVAVQNKGDELGPLSGEVDVFNSDLAAQINLLKAGLQAFRYAFPEGMADGPAAGGRLAQLESDLASITPIDQPVLSAVTESGTRLRLIVNNGLSNELVNVGTLLNRLASCTNDATGLSPALADRIDTANTLAGLAMTKLGVGYVRSLESCHVKLSRPPLSTQPPATEANRPITPPVYLLRFWPAEQPTDIRYLLYEKITQLPNGLFLVVDQNGAPWRYPGEYSGAYSDKAGLCAVLRGYGLKSASYPNGQDFISCAAEGPRTAPTKLVGPGAPSSTSSIVSPSSARPVGFTIKSITGTAAHRVTPSGTTTPLDGAGRVDPGSGIQTGSASRVVLSTASGTSITVEPETKIKVSASTSATVVNLERGAVEVSHLSGSPSLDDHAVETEEGKVVPTGTRYRVVREPSGTNVEVFEGSVHLTGAAIIRIASLGRETAVTPAPVTALDLRAGERARLMNVRIMTGAPVSAAAPLPAWASGTTAGRPTPPAAAQPDNLWNDARIQGWMDEWLRTAIPPTNTPNVIMHYNEWAQPLSQAATATGRPDHPADWTRYRYLWESRAKWTSTKLCSLGEFLDHRLANKLLDDCAGGLPSWAAGRGNQPPAAPPSPGKATIATAQPLGATQRDQTKKQQPGVAGTASALSAVPPRNSPAQKSPQPGESGRDAVSPLAGDWSCDGTANGSGSVGGARMPIGEHPAEPLTLRIVPANGAFRISATLDGDDNASFTATVTGSTIRGTNSGHRDDWLKAEGYTFNAAYEFTLQGQLLNGTYRYRDNSSLGTDSTSNYRCRKADSDKK